MWQKVNPVWMRVGIMKSRPCEWFSRNKQQDRTFFVEDIKIRNEVEKAFPKSWIAKIVIRKTNKEVEVIVFTSKVGILMWKNWEKIKQFEDKLKTTFKKDIKITVKEIKNPELSAKVMAEFVSSQLEARMPFRKVAKNTIQKVMEKWAVWIKVQIWWRLWWADIARSEKFIDWKVSLQTFRSDIDYHYMQAMTKYWVLWVKVWIQKWTLYNQKAWQKKLNIQ